ncbi:peroxiredoxin, SACOL1771 subfamily [Aneurinibacillus thermoaerophilus]|uniref:Peroxiredoxin, SACOL1771 subfamily n=1 Tax=Aneurinibacillus thermoaerophilus TaxID=143495 RepID=A0A1G7XZM8_ANETH|nr:SACOL1771 family peroxiredoxin [Aneurinibacillus thermoaerophilus]MED0675943.1 SACOL1771 family peroxiredoxin [Aneurinibacillus thermoaerophilus]SDG89563.1 peroxiredoxin, SACOL1771 subfamily [Aneurinibacillus thermoaerophilus]
MAEHHFYLKADWKGGRDGEGRISVGNLQAPISVPKEMNGPGVGTNPDEMLIGAAATCYLITLAAILQNRGIGVSDLHLESEGIVIMEGSSPRFQKIIHRPRITLEAEAAEEQIETVVVLAERAEKACMVSKAVQGNVEVLVEADVVIA